MKKSHPKLNIGEKIGVQKNLRWEKKHINRYVKKLCVKKCCVVENFVTKKLCVKNKKNVFPKKISSKKKNGSKTDPLKVKNIEMY